MTHQDLLRLLQESDSFAAIESIAGQGDALTVSKLFATMANDLYWKVKNLPGAIAISQAGITYSLTTALRERDTEIANQLRGQAKAIAFNLGSFCWPGWDEPGIDIGAKELAAGFDAARCNLRLAIELKRPSKAMGNAHWMIGSYELAKCEFDSAIQTFAKARDTFTEDRVMALMAAGYRELADNLKSGGGTSPQLKVARDALLKE
ncbi:MAG TPA: hypothetical protein VL282_08340, partial [Tepidisphaeraceae bacterium]|nr:hypothetical protein [Tepidisphaeraceae bacterium]